MADGNGADSAGSERTQWTAGPANTSRMWNPVHEVLLDRDNRLLLMSSPTTHFPPLHHHRDLSGHGGNLGDGFVVTSGPGFENECIHDFSTLLVFHD